MILDQKSSQEYPVNTGVPQASILGPWLFLICINDLPDDAICNIAVYVDDTTHYSKCDRAFDLWQQLKLAFELESNLWDTVDWGRNGLLIWMLKKLNRFGLTSLITQVPLMWKWTGLFLRKNHLLRCWGELSPLTFSLLLKLLPRKPLIRSKFLSPEVTLYLYKYTILPCMEYGCHMWACALSCSLQLLDKL